MSNTAEKRTFIDLQNMEDFADELKSKYARAATVAALESRVDTLTGEGEGSIAKIVDAAINKFATDVTDDNVVNSFKELVDWVAEHGSEAAELAGGIEENKTAIADLKTLLGELPDGITATTVIGYIAEALEGYVKTSEIQTATETEIRALLADEAQ